MSLITLGRHSYIGDGALISTPVTVGNFCSIAPGLHAVPRIQHPCIANPRLVSSSSRAIPGYPKPYSEEGISIGHDVWIGEGVTLLGGAIIGDGAIVGAFSVIAHYVAPYSIVVGNPAKVIRYRFDKDTINRLLDVQWWHWSDDLIRERQEDLRDAHTLVTKYAYERFPHSDSAPQ